MPPKKRGHNLTGKNKLFRHAVEHVHVGVGHTVLGNLSLQLAVGPKTGASSSSSNDLSVTGRQDALLADRPAFYIELQEQLLMHTSKDFKQFRWEMLEHCETKPLFYHNHRQIAEKLLVCLLSRTGGSYSTKSKNDARGKRGRKGSEGDDTSSDKGLTSDGFEAFVRLTIAFARDMQANFLPYFEVFQKAVQAGLYDKNGRLIVDTTRLQLVYAAQAAWCREMLDYWCVPAHAALCRSVIRLYVDQMRDTKEYIRRLSAELLAFLGRMCRPLIPLIAEEAAGDILTSFEHFAVGKEQELLVVAGDGDEEGDDGDEEDDEGEQPGMTDESKKSKALAHGPSIAAGKIWSEAHLREYIRDLLPSHPVHDGLVFFAAELFRGIKGSLNSSFESHYVRLLECFLIVDASARAKLGKKGEPLASYLDEYDSDEEDTSEMEDDSASGNNEGQRTHKKKRKGKVVDAVHATRWTSVLLSVPATHQNTDASLDSTDQDAEGATCVGPQCIRVAHSLIREFGSSVLGNALQAMLYETRKNSRGGHHEEDDEDSDVSSNEDSAEEKNEHSDLASLDMDGDMRPTHRLLTTVSACMQPLCSHSVRLLGALLNAAGYYLWSDRREVAALKKVAGDMRDCLREVVGEKKKVATAKDASSTTSAVQIQDAAHSSTSSHVLREPLPYAAAVLELLHPLCVAPYVPRRELSAQLQKCFLPVGRAAVSAIQQQQQQPCAAGVHREVMKKTTSKTIGNEQCDSSTSSFVSSSFAAAAFETEEKAQLALFAFAQDVLQKNYSLCLAEERRMAEEVLLLRAEKQQAGKGSDDDEEDGREDAYAAEEEGRGDGLGFAKSGARSSNNSSSHGYHHVTTAASSISFTVQSNLTPLALTLLHGICLASWQRAGGYLAEALHPTSSTQIEETTAISSTPSTHEQKKKNSKRAEADASHYHHDGDYCEEVRKGMAMSYALQQRCIQRAVLLARIASDRTEHMPCSPLQQLLRLRPASATPHTATTATEGSSSDGASKPEAGMEFSFALQRLLLHLAQLFVRLKACTNISRTSPKKKEKSTNHGSHDTHAATSGRLLHFYSAQEAAELLACALPLVGSLSQISKAAAASVTSSGSRSLQDALLAVLESIKSSNSNNNNNNNNGSNIHESSLLSADEYALYAHISSLLVNLSSSISSSTAGGSGGATGGGGSKKALKNKKATTSAMTEQDMERQATSLKHLSGTIAMLAKGFAISTEGGTSTHHQHNHSEEERLQLVRGAEVLIRSLLTCLGLDVLEREEEAGAERAEKAAAASSSSSTALSKHTRRALGALRHALSDDTQQLFVNAILMESLVAPAQPLRLLSLRLLRLLCHPQLDEATERLVGLSAIEPQFFTALLQAEEFNPLSQTGNLDGIKQALTRMTFSAEAGQIVDPLQRTILARAMIGMLYVKFSGAWEAAMRILTSLVRQERTSLLPPPSSATAAGSSHHNNARDRDEDDMDSTVGEEEEEERDEATVDGKKAVALKRLNPIVWDTVIRRYAHLLIFGDVIGRGKTTATTTAVNDGGDAFGEEDKEKLERHLLDSSSAAAAFASPVDLDAPSCMLKALVASAVAELVSLENHAGCLYRLRLTDQQRHEKGELASKAFSSAQYAVAAETLVDLTTEDGELLSWSRHWSGNAAHEDEAQNARNNKKKSTSAKYTGTAAALTGRSTDRATLAQTFLAGLADMMKSGSPYDKKLCLIEDVLLELVSIQRNEHPSGLTQLKRLDDRIALAMRACSVAPSTVISSGQRKRSSGGNSNNTVGVPQAILDSLDARNETLKTLFISYVSDANGKLQRAAIDNLKRLKVEPFCTYHAQLTPYCDVLKSLFAFLSSFHVESDVEPHSRADYVSVALAISLPKLVVKVSKEKRKDQAVLSRRLMSFLSHLPSSATTTTTGGRGNTAITEVLDKLVQRLIFARVAPSTGALQVTSFDFLAEWNRRVQARENHCARRLERLIKQLLNAIRLLESLLHATGRQFAAYTRSCLHLAMQGYLLACKQHLREPVDSLLADLDAKRGEKRLGGKNLKDDDDDDEEARESGLGKVSRSWADSLLRSLSSSTLSLSLAHLRRASLTVVTLLFEQFPEEVMAATVEEARSSSSLSSSIDLRHSLVGRYIVALSGNSQGVTHDAARQGSGVRAASYVTPMLRLVTAWVEKPVFFPLLVAFPSEVTDTFVEVFAVNPYYVASSSNAEPVHRASNKAVYDGLRIVTDILHQGDVPLDASLIESGSDTDQKSHKEKKKHSGSGKGEVSKKSTRATTAAAAAVVTLQDAFIGPHIVPIFTALYHLVVSGTTTGTPDAEESGAGAEGVVRHREVSTTGSRRDRTSVMSFSVAMWREIIQTVSLLTSCLTSSAKSDVAPMLGKLLEIAMKFVTHPVCIADAATAVMASEVIAGLVGELPRADAVRHCAPLAHLFNVVANPKARLVLCKAFQCMAGKLVIADVSSRYGNNVGGKGEAKADEGEQVNAMGDAFQAQVRAVGHAVASLNSFEDTSTMERYDFELRYHTYHALIDFFANTENGEVNAETAMTAASKRHHRSASSLRSGSAKRKSNANVDGSTVKDAARREREYTAEQQVHIPLDRALAPVLCVEAFNVLAANVMFFLRDPESTIRALSGQLLHAMMRYASHNNNKEAIADASSARAAGCVMYDILVLEHIVRREILSSLRRGVVSRNVHIRNDHMVAFGALAKYYPRDFPSFARLYATDGTQSFYHNVGHVQPKCRLHALALLRREASQMNVRDLLRVFVPFLMSAVKDFAQGKRDLQNLTEGKAKGYCDAVLSTIATITEKLPWEAYYRVLTLFLSNASANASLRMPMLRGVVQVLNYFHFLDNEEAKVESAGVPAHAGMKQQFGGEDADDEDDDDDNDVEDDDEAVLAEVREKRRQFRHAKITQVLEADILPQLFQYISEGKKAKKTLGIAEGVGNAHNINALRKEQEKEDKAKSSNAILQLPVAIAITKIVKKFPEERFNFYVEHLLDEIIKKLRTKQDKQRESARRILGAMLQESGPSKLKFVVTALKDNLVHGYQLHVLGYTVVTLLYQLYEPQSSLLRRSDSSGGKHPHLDHKKPGRFAVDPIQEALEDSSAKRRRTEDDEDDKDDRQQQKQQQQLAKSRTRSVEREDDQLDEDTRVEVAEEELIRQLNPHRVSFDYAYGVDCLTAILDDLLVIFLDDYLGEVGMQKEQVEVMSTMMEVKHNRALQGFALLARHCNAGVVMDSFLHRITWVLTPPSDNNVAIEELHGSARARALLVEEMKGKYLAVSKNAGADLVFVSKVRLLAVRVARSLMANPTAEVQLSFEKVRDLLNKHNERREEKIRAFEAKDGTRRIRGNAHVTIHGADKKSYKEQLDNSFLLAPVPERVDVDFSTHTVLATQQKQKLRAYKGRYGKEVREAAKDFYREDPTAAVVLDTLDEFLLKYLLSVLKRVLGIGKEKHYSKAAVQLDLLRRKAHAATVGELSDVEDDGAQEEKELEGQLREDKWEAENANENANDGRTEEEERDADDVGSNEEDEDALDPQELDDEEEDALGHFVAAQEAAEEEETHNCGNSTVLTALRKTKKKPQAPNTADLAAAFTREHRDLLESLVKVVLTTLEGEGGDPVVANALDCLLALVSLRPPLDAVKALDTEMFDTITSFFARGGAIKQRAMRVCSAVISHQKFALKPDQASRLVQLARAEIMDRSEFLPMALGLLYAVMGKHVHVADVYDMIDIITEMLVHLGAKRIIRNRCVLILVRFLTEYKLTPDKFRSHIDLFCKNLDYPDLAGRLALLDLLDALISRLPTVVLRSEAPVLLVPLSATLTGGEWRESREKAGAVLQNLVKNAGVDVLVPLLESRMAPSQSRPVRGDTMQTWAVLITGIAKAHGLTHDIVGASAAAATALDEEEQDAFLSCCLWSLPSVLEGCMFDQVASTGRDKTYEELSAKAKEKAELKGWTYIYYSLRCMESMCAAAPERLYPHIAKKLVPCLIHRLTTHAHTWVQAAALRILRGYCYGCAEVHSGFLQDDWTVVSSMPDEAEEEDDAVAEGGGVDGMPLVLKLCHQRLLASNASASLSLSGYQKLFVEIATALKRLLARVAASDVSNEKYTAHRTMQNPARAESLKIMVWLTKALERIAMVMTIQFHSSTVAVCTFLDRQYALLRRQMESIAAPMLRQNSVVNYMVRTATLIQFLGGFITVLPRLAPAPAASAQRFEGDEEEEEVTGEVEEEECVWMLREKFNAAARGLAQHSIQALQFADKTVAPLLEKGVAASPISGMISIFANQATSVVKQQLEDRRGLFAVRAAPRKTHLVVATATTTSDESKKKKEIKKMATLSRKRAREEEEGEEEEVGAEAVADANDDAPPLDVVLAHFITSIAAVRDTKRFKQIEREVRVSQKRTRRQMSMADKQGGRR